MGFFSSTRKEGSETSNGYERKVKRFLSPSISPTSALRFFRSTLGQGENLDPPHLKCITPGKPVQNDVEVPQPRPGSEEEDDEGELLSPGFSDVYSGDEDDLQAEVDAPMYEGSVNDLSSTDILALHRRLSPQYASSIIGGVSLSAREADSPVIDHQESLNPTRQPDETPGSVAVSSTLKIFNFSLPFTNPSFERLTSIPLLSSISSGSSMLPSISFPKIGNMRKEHDEEEEERERIRRKLSRQESINSVEEGVYYRDITKLDDLKMAALRKAIVPSLSDDGWNDKIFDEIDGDVLIMGGYRGSILRDAKTDRRAWIPVLKAGLNIRKINLLLGPKDEDEYDVEKSIYPDGMLSHVGPVDISRKLMKRLSSNPKVTVHNWGYDWRLSTDISSKRLHLKLKEIYAKNGGKPVILIGHSMGGIVAHGAMLLDKTLVRGIIYAGTPLPCVNVMGPFRYNDNILLCNDMLTSEVNFMMRSTFIFIPNKDQCLFKDIRTGEHFEIDFFDPKMWVKYNLSPIVSSVRLRQERGEPVDIRQQSEFAISFDEAYDYLCRTLRRTKKFREFLKYDPNVVYPPLALVYGNRVPSVKYSLVDGKEDVKKGTYYNFFYGPGDGVTHQKYLFPEDASYPLCGKFASRSGHIGLLSDSLCVAQAFKAILNEEKRRKMQTGASLHV
ncbi:DEKNAAC101350 [Brettanomyces naardenensis]|uniref:DEKNAAC101350 n=1 Tax=Brettanomyces naardenensis TaxID=13370 RepID=A0A448YHH1_BRENA|nr:DEKNAAC101350 [Brettanomyces naardenensis]